MDIGDTGVLHARQTRTSGARSTLFAAAFAIGITVGAYQPLPWVGPWLIIAATCTLVAALSWAFGTLHLRTSFPFLITAIVALGAAWHTLMTQYVAPNDLAVLLHEETGVIRITGIAQQRPEIIRQPHASLAHFGYRSASTYVPVRVTTIEHADGSTQPARGRVLISIGETVPPFRAGDRVTATGHFNTFEEARNPGELNRKQLAKAMGQAGSMYLPTRELLQIESSYFGAPREWWLTWREHLQRRADALLLADLPESESTQRDALLKALLLGQREPDLFGLNESFRRLGIAHFLAISGLHLGILAAMFIGIMRMMGGTKQWHAVLLIGLIILYLVLIEVRTPVARAGIMTIAACVGLTFSRRLSAAGLVSLSAIALLLWQPEQLFWPGFQLSFAVVLGLLHLSPLLREQWFGLRNNEPSTVAEMLFEWFKDALVIGCVAWLVATPIVAFHFGMIAPLGILLAVVGVPVVAVLLALGYAKIVLAMVLPSLAMLLGRMLAVATETAISIVTAIDDLPHIVGHVPFPGAAWTLAALAFVCFIIAKPSWLRRWRWKASTALLILWLMWPAWTQPQYALRLDMLSVGHGTCIVLRSEGETIIFDAGSNTRLDAGTRWIIPALRRLGVNSIDAIVISHPHFDHYSAVLELVESHHPDHVHVTHQFVEHARENPDIALTYLADVLVNKHHLPPRPTVKGDERTLGQAQLTWLHPPKDLTNFRRDNQQSMVIRIEAAGRTVLLTGDVERAGLAWLLTNQDDLRADVLEMPHHGAWHDLTGDLLERVQPSVVLQSSGRSQWQRDRWQSALDKLGAARLVTHRDGAVWVEIMPDGTIRSGSHRN